MSSEGVGERGTGDGELPELLNHSDLQRIFGSDKQEREAAPIEVDGQDLRRDRPWRQNTDQYDLVEGMGVGLRP